MKVLSIIDPGQYRKAVLRKIVDEMVRVKHGVFHLDTFGRKIMIFLDSIYFFGDYVK